MVVAPQPDKKALIIERDRPPINGGTTGGRFAGCSVPGQGGGALAKAKPSSEPARKDTRTSYPERFEERHAD